MNKLPHLQVIQGRLTSLTESGPISAPLKGMSLYWSMWGQEYWKPETLTRLKNEWGCNVVRLPVGSHETAKGYVGYSYGNEVDRVRKLLDHAIRIGLYVILDVHNHEAVKERVYSLKLLSEISEIYGDCPNIIYEVVNEPLGSSWVDIRSYAEEAINIIRFYAPSAVCLVGTPDWCKEIEVAINEPVNASNIMYTFHFYSATHQDSERRRLANALEKQVPVFVSECGVSEADGTGNLNYPSFDKWLELLSTHGVSWCGWAVNDKAEKSSTFESGEHFGTDWVEDSITDVGLFYRDRITNYASEKRGIVYQGFYSSPYGSRTEENKILEYKMRRTINIPLDLLKVALKDIVHKAGEKDYDLILMWLLKNYRNLDTDVKVDIEKYVEEVIKAGADPKTKWSLFRLRDTINFTKTSGKVPR